MIRIVVLDPNTSIQEMIFRILAIALKGQDYGVEGKDSVHLITETDQYDVILIFWSSSGLTGFRNLKHRFPNAIIGIEGEEIETIRRETADQADHIFQMTSEEVMQDNLQLLTSLPVSQ